MNHSQTTRAHTASSSILNRALIFGLAVLMGSTLGACGGGGGSNSSAPLLPATSLAAALGDPNVVPVYVDGGPKASTSSVPNAIYADIKVCAPGSATNCVVIDHVMVDTGSVGLRVFSSAIPPALLAAMPQASADGGRLAGECLAFGSGVTWGGVRLADLRLGGSSFNGELARNLSMQIIGDSDARLAAIPASCSSQGAMMSNSAALGANGVLGIGLFANDCGFLCSVLAASVYYSCPSAGACLPSVMAPRNQVSNPISSFGSDSNGNTLVMPFPYGGYASRLDGLLVFGIGTRPNNSLAAGSSILGADTSGHFQSVFNGNTLPNSFIDSGSSINFFPSSGTSPFPICAFPIQTFLCPPSPLTLNSANSGRAATSSLASVYLVNAIEAFHFGANAIPGLGGASPPPFNSLDLGSSFFYGRSISTLIEDKSAAGFSVTGPAFSYTP